LRRDNRQFGECRPTEKRIVISFGYCQTLIVFSGVAPNVKAGLQYDGFFIAL
jgi:hypothetical protein